MTGSLLAAREALERLRWPLALVWSLALAACGGETAPQATDTASEPRVTCGGDGSWPPSLMAEGIPGVLTDAEAKAAFQSLLDDPRLRPELSLSLFPDGVDVEWRVLAEDGDMLTIGLGRWTDRGPADGAYVLGLQRDGDRWSTGGWGDCQLAPVLDEDAAWARVERYRQAPDGSLEVEVSERECTSGRQPDDHLHEPEVVETADSVTITWTTTPAHGDQSCQGNPSTTRSVELDQPLGFREVRDGSTYPPRAVPSR